jgi:hypothetical protein
MHLSTLKLLPLLLVAGATLGLRVPDAVASHVPGLAAKPRPLLACLKCSQSGWYCVSTSRGVTNCVQGDHACAVAGTACGFSSGK